ncbi:MAG: hypothetical protein C3F12_00150 [Candidatus Methylomirabilota bacterium]|nr:hypothetical protein [Candidatus Methylomirabilis sp.]NJD68737.1 hypothetical protein [candidate division NC10 bacterium]PWB48947.1 MAG: hypothetical protein C3F12_00150 [candidate division NC10 bacterium]
MRTQGPVGCIRVRGNGQPLTEVYVVGVYWPEKWRRLLRGLSAAELSVVSVVAQEMRDDLKGTERGLVG